MSETLEAEIRQVEEELRLAMLSSDVPVLERLLAPALLFTNHLGQQLGKQEDIAAHRSGLLKVRELNSSEQKILIVGAAAIVSVRMQLSGTYDGNPASGDFRFTRVWSLLSEKNWQLIAAHAGTIT